VRLSLARFSLFQRIAGRPSRCGKRISANLAAWLAPLRRRARVVPSYRQHREITALAKSLGIPWPRNVLRHSFISYRIAIVKSADQVALREPVEKPGPLARRAIFPHGKARRGRRLAPSIDNSFWKPIWDNNLVAHVSRRLFDSLIRFPQSRRQAVWESRLPPA
jgi:hypothetical protein